MPICVIDHWARHLPRAPTQINHLLAVVHHSHLGKTGCRHELKLAPEYCINYPQGREVDSQEGDKLFRINGIQTLSGKEQNLINDLPSMQGLVDMVRISPSGKESLAWLTLFQQNVDGKAAVSIDGYCNGYWHKIEGMMSV